MKKTFPAPAMTTRRVAQIVSAILGFAGPVALGAMSGHAGAGVLTALGGLVLGEEGQTFREHVSGLMYAIGAGSIAMLAGSAVSGHGALSFIAIVAISAVAAIFGTLSRPLAVAAARFMIFSVIAVNIGTRGVHSVTIMCLFCLGAFWTAGLSLGLRVLFSVLHVGNKSPTSGEIALVRGKNTAQQLFLRWCKSLTRLSGWQYVLRITLCLAVAQGFNCLWPHHHGYWALITVAMLVRRDRQATSKLTFRCGIGTVIGVLTAGLLVVVSLPLWAQLPAIAILAAARIVFVNAYSIAYVAAQTPLFILLLDFGRTPSWATVVDRLAATLAGCAIALTFGYAGWSGVSPSERKITVSKGEP